MSLSYNERLQLEQCRRNEALFKIKDHFTKAKSSKSDAGNLDSFRRSVIRSPWKYAGGAFGAGLILALLLNAFRGRGSGNAAPQRIVIETEKHQSSAQSTSKPAFSFMDLGVQVLTAIGVIRKILDQRSAHVNGNGQEAGASRPASGTGAL